MTEYGLIEPLVERLVQVAGIRGIVLGGSRALGTHTAESDFDVGLYYDPNSPPDLEALQQVASEIDDRHSQNLITPLGGWGPWINGGGWLKIRGRAVDLLYRDLARVGQVITDCNAGQIDMYYMPGHPHGFATHIYAGEVAACHILWDPFGDVMALKALVTPYPAALRRAVIDRFLWETRFSVDIARKSVARADVSYAAGCCFRGVACLVQVLFARNERYLLNEKGALAAATTLSVCPPNLKPRVEAVFRRLDADGAAIEEAVMLLEGIVSEVEALATP